MAYRTVTQPDDPIGRGYWEGVFRDGPMCLTRHAWGRIKDHLPSDARQVFDALIDSVERQAKWVAEFGDATNLELERVSRLGLVMQRAGLRSYTDDKGRIYVAADTKGDNR